MEYDDAKWVMIFHHKYPSGGLFSDEECLKSLHKHKFNVIGSINDRFKINSKYYFLIEYPSRGDYLQWEQSKEITHDESVDATVYNESFISFYGLGSSYDTAKTCYDGTPGDHKTDQWWYSIGTKNGYNSTVAIPGPCSVRECIPLNEVNLWIKFDDIFVLKNLPKLRLRCTIFNKRKPTSSFSILASLFIVSS